MAAANWHASTAFLAQLNPASRGLFVDCGSTTTDLVPFAAGQVASPALTDLQRLSHGTLLYTGVVRTPLISLADTVLLDGHPCPLAAEWFATTLDIYRILGNHTLSASGDSSKWQRYKKSTADGKSLSLNDCHRRLSRMVCADASELGSESILSMATQLMNQQMERISIAMERQFQLLEELHPDHETDLSLLACGDGEFLIEAALSNREFRQGPANLTRLSRLFSEDISDCFAAYAVAKLLESCER